MEKFNDLWLSNAMWFMFVAMSTVGYGDFVPTTIGGRIICAIAIFQGIIIVALLTGTMFNLITYSNHEKEAMALLRRQDSLEKLKVVAGRMILRWYYKHRGKVLNSKDKARLNR